ncbi:hypothetical protein BFP72_02480 [Reichenbachiella sp. 5M10]|nr:hypothetical protein BFP72_02480 [Reichenbachiella sp. 5M10]
MGEPFDALKEETLAQVGLVKVQAKNPVYDIEPFATEHQQQTFKGVDREGCFSMDETGSEYGGAYTFWIEEGLRKPVFRRWHLRADIYFESVYEYGASYIKSTTIIPSMLFSACFCKCTITNT